MSSKELKELQEFIEKHTSIFKDELIRFHLSNKDAEYILGFPIKEIISWKPREDVPKELHQYTDNHLTIIFIIGGAIPSLEGWEVISLDDTRFVAVGFNDQSVTFTARMDDYRGVQLTIVEDSPEPEEQLFSVVVEYSEELATLISFVNQKHYKTFKLS